MKFLIRLLLLVLPLAASAQSNLPNCSPDPQSYRDKCYGQLISADGTRYVGEFLDNKMHGRGSLTWPDRRQYIGEWRNGKRHGKATALWPDGRKYIGEIRDDKANGHGAFSWPNGNTYVGEWRNDRRNGFGVFSWSDGRKFVGEYRDNKRNGQGIEYLPGGSVGRSGRWVDDNLAHPFALDTARFPFDGPSQATASNADPGRADRERLAAEGENSRRRQQELEQKLTAEARERERQAAEVEAVRRRQQELEAQLAALQSQSASRPPAEAAAVRNQRRVALVIGNAAYKSSPLDNPVNDATDVDQTLRQLGFQTTLVRNATLGQMREATRKFAEQLPSADVALIYFAGHGIESNRKNYMIPVNAELQFVYELDDQAYNAGQWLEMLESIRSTNAERVNIVILDACRNNNLIGSRSFGRGLGRMDAPTGTFLAFSTAPGKVAADGARGQRNSPFTRHLLSVMQQPGLPIEEAFKEIRRNVSRETNGAQVPWESTSLTGFFTFRQVR